MICTKDVFHFEVHMTFNDLAKEKKILCKKINKFTYELFIRIEFFQGIFSYIKYLNFYFVTRLKYQ